MSWENTHKILASLFDLPKPRLDKFYVLYHIAMAAPPAQAIVELGTFHGGGAIALASGARDGNGAKVYTIDDCQDRIGWATERFTSSDYKVAERNCKKAGVKVKFVRQKVEEAAKNWTKPIGLWFWDLGADYGQPATMLADFLQWERHIAIGGIVYLRDTFDKHFKSDLVVSEAKKYSVIRDDPGILLLQKGA